MSISGDRRAPRKLPLTDAAFRGIATNVATYAR